VLVGTHRYSRLRGARVLFVSRGAGRLMSQLSTRLRRMNGGHDPVPSDLLLSLDDAFRVLEALEDAMLAMEEAAIAPGLRDELVTVIRLLHGRLGLDEGGAL
jgi:hypothetical protein